MTRRVGLPVVACLLALPACSGPGAEARSGGPALTPSETSTVSTTASPASDSPAMPTLRNGRIASAQTHYGMRSGYNTWLDYDPVSDTGLVVVCRDEDGTTDDGCTGEDALVVVGPGGSRTALTCPEDRPHCGLNRLDPRYGAALGPGEDEVTAAAGHGTVQVVGYDGRRRRTIDLTAAGVVSGDVVRMDWSSDGRHLAVATTSPDGGIWLVDATGTGPELACTTRERYRVFDGPWWSPDGQSLVVDVGRLVGTSVHLDLLVLHVAPDGEARVAPPQTLLRSERHFDWPSNGNLAWAPDGTRLAVRTANHVTEISAEDGRVIAQHPHVGWLIWPARDR